LLDSGKANSVKLNEKELYCQKNLDDVESQLSSEVEIAEECLLIESRPNLLNLLSPLKETFSIANFMSAAEQLMWPSSLLKLNVSDKELAQVS